ncbi:cupin domain-containing protein [Actinomycetospora sp. C-140]
MTSVPPVAAPTAPTVLTAEEQRAVWFLGALVRVRTGGEATGGSLAVLEHRGERGYSSPLHRHTRDEETFLVLDGELRVEVDGAASAAGPGTAAVLPRNLPHAFVVVSPEARFLTIHTPAGFDAFTLAVGQEAVSLDAPPADAPPPDPAELTRVAARFGLEILGPPPAP